MSGLPLENALVWREDGHLSDLLVSTVADEQLSLVPPNALQHLDGCEQCSGRVVAMMITSTLVDAEFAELSIQGYRLELAESTSPAPPSPFPVHWFMVVGLVVTLANSRELQSALLRTPSVLREAGANLRMFFSALSLLRERTILAAPLLSLVLVTLTLASFVLLYRALTLPSKGSFK